MPGNSCCGNLPNAIPIRSAFQAEQRLSQIPEVTSTLTQIGGQTRAFRGGSVGEANVAQVQVTVESDRPTREFFPAMREAMALIPDADVTVTMDRAVLDNINLFQTTIEDAVADGSAKVNGDAAKFGEFLAMLDTFELYFNIVAP